MQELQFRCRWWGAEDWASFIRDAVAIASLTVYGFVVLSLSGDEFVAPAWLPTLSLSLITGGDSGIGRAVALAFAREGADVVIAYWNEHEDARETQRVVEASGRRTFLIPGDLSTTRRPRERSSPSPRASRRDSSSSGRRSPRSWPPPTFFSPRKNRVTWWAKVLGVTEGKPLG